MLEKVGYIYAMVMLIATLISVAAVSIYMHFYVEGQTAVLGIICIPFMPILIGMIVKAMIIKFKE